MSCARNCVVAGATSVAAFITRTVSVGNDLYMLLRLAISLTVLHTSSDAERDLENPRPSATSRSSASVGEEAGPAAGRPNDPG